AWIVVMKPSIKPNSSFNTLATGANELVVHEAPETTSSEPSKVSWLVLYTIVFKSPLAGAEINTFLAPALMCASAFSFSVNKPVHSNTTSISKSPQGSLLGSGSENDLTSNPLTRKPSSSTSTSPVKRPCVVSYFNK